MWLFVSFVSVWPCDGQATCPGCTLSPDDRWDRLQPPRDLTDGLVGIENGWMDISFGLFVISDDVYTGLQAPD